MRGNANVWYFEADLRLSQWAETGNIDDQQGYTEALNAIKNAHSLDPGHPHYVYMLGQIIHWGVDYQFESAARLLEVKQWYLTATELRPLWPDPWIDLARLNNYLEGFNSTTKDYLAQALKTGPYIDLVTSGSLQLLLLNWSRLSGGEKKLLFEQFNIAVKQNKVLKSTLSSAKQIGREKLLCTQLKFNPEYIKQKESSIYNKYCK